MKAAIAYIGVSTAKQGKSGLGLEAQQEALARFAEAEGLYEAPQVKSVFGGVLPIGQLPLPRRRAFGCLHSWHDGPSLLGRAERSTPRSPQGRAVGARG
jgi:hypothetical protein